ncbi:hypothetical protein F6X50_20630 [Dickeya dianthicola]|nr:hypothetical protein [Dickeya dianthicola]MZI91435.1 hypothetical protein [Dickeya dianthicola]
MGTGAVLATETVESLLANPKRLKELRQQCYDDRDRVGNALCNRVGHAGDAVSSLSRLACISF